jgi:hypothetical protein
MSLTTTIKIWATRLLLTLAVAPAASCSNVDGDEAVVCENPLSFAISTDKGDVYCPNGLAHRAAILECRPANLAQCTSGPNGSDGTSTGADGTSQCASDADCNDGPNGVCQNTDPGCACNYGCLNDADCGPAQACICGMTRGVCVAAGCTTDAECSGSSCVLEPILDADGHLVREELACLTPADSCVVDSHCGEGKRCARIDGHLACMPVPPAPPTGPKE